MIFVYIQLIHFTVQQKVTQYNTLQLKKRKIKGSEGGHGT